MKTKIMILAVSLAVLLGAAATAMADATIIPITMYEVRGTVTDRTGPYDGRSADYTGTVTQNAGTGLWYYKGGVGSLNNGATFEGVNNGQQLFKEGIGTAIDLYFGENSYYSITGMRIYGGNPDSGYGLFNDTQTGSLTQLTIKGYDHLSSSDVQTPSLVTTPEHEVSPLIGSPTMVDDYIDLTEYFAGVAVQSLTLFDFLAADGYQGGFTFCEIEVYGSLVQLPETAAVPEPSTVVLLGLGLIGLATFGRKRFSGRA